MRVLALGMTLCIAAAAAEAQVHLVIKSDGTKVISNLGASGRGASLGEWAKLRNRRSPYDPLIERYSATYGVDPILVRAVIQVESDFNPRCVSYKGARGLMQLMPDTAHQYGVRAVFDPEDNIRAGVHYLADLLIRYGSDLQRALAAYNAGDGAVAKYHGIPPYEETMTYVKRALTVYYGRPWGGGGVSFAAVRGAKRLKGGFGAQMAAPIALLPNVRYLGAVGR
jgi:soluble lytic murein transglycosylase